MSSEKSEYNLSTEQHLRSSPEKGEGHDGSVARERSARHDGMNEMLETLQIELRQLRGAFNAKLKYDAQKQATINRLHEELQWYKDAEDSQGERPMFHDLISLHDDFDSILRYYEVPDTEVSKEDALQQLRGFQQSVLDILEKHDVFAFVHPEDTFNTKQQQALHLTVTTDPNQARRVRSRVRAGFKLRDRVLRPEGVDVYKYRAPETVSSKGETIKRVEGGSAPEATLLEEEDASRIKARQPPEPVSDSSEPTLQPSSEASESPQPHTDSIDEPKAEPPSIDPNLFD